MNDPARRPARSCHSGAMKLAALALLALVAAAWPGAAAASPVRDAGAGVDPWRRVFTENFSRDLSPRRWGHYTGHPGGDPGGLWDPSHVVVRNGKLRLETYRDPRFGNRWVSGGTSSARALKQTYGRYRVRLRMDGGRGVAGIALLWPSADVWPPEVDFAETGGLGRGRPGFSATLHHGADDHQIQREARADLTGWHVVGVDWTPGRLAYVLDGKVWAVVRSAHVPSQPMELDLQTQAGTCGDAYAPCPDASTPRRVTMQVDWVHVDALQGPR